MTECFIADEFCVPQNDRSIRLFIKPFNPETGFVSKSQELLLDSGNQQEHPGFWVFNGYVTRQGSTQINVRGLFPMHGNIGCYSSLEPLSELKEKLFTVLNRQQALIPG